MIHPPGAVPTFSPAHSQFRVQENIIELFGSFQYENRINLPKPHGSCVSQFPKGLVSVYPQFANYNYTKHICYTAKYSQMEMLFPLPENTSRILGDVHCHDECDQVLFNDFKMNYVMHSEKSNPFKYAKVMLFSDDLTTTTIRQLPAATFEGLLGTVGGLLGLWLGASMLSMLEFCELIANLTFLSCSKIKRSWARPKVKDLNV